MKRLIAKYRSLSFEERLIVTTAITMSGSALIAAGKIIIGLFSDFILVVVGLFGALLFTAKLQCILGAKKKSSNFKVRNALTALFLLIAGLLYILYMGRILLFDVESQETGTLKAIIIATISFFEMGLAIYGLVKTKNKGHYYRDIKIVNFVSGMTAIMTAQIALTSLSEENNNFYNGITGVGIGIITVFLAIYVYFAPKISIIDREYNAFVLKKPSLNQIIDMNGNGKAEIVLCKSKIYSNVVYSAQINGTVVEGDIIKLKSGLRQFNVYVKILLIILSELLVFVWMLGYAVYFFRSMDLPQKLENLMSENGFEKLTEIDRNDAADGSGTLL